MKQFSATRIYILILAVLLTVAVLCACSATGTLPGETTADDLCTTEESVTSTGEAATETVDLSAEFLTVAEDGVCLFTIVTPDADNGENAIAMTIRAAILDLAGVSQVEMKTDWRRDGEEHDPYAFEILIGQTDYAESSSVLRDTPYGAYTIRAVGRKIVLSAWDNASLTAAGKRLVALMTTALQGNSIVLAGDVYEETVVDEALYRFPTVPNAQISYIYNAFLNDQLIYEGLTEAHYHDYLASLENRGYTCYADYSRGTVRSATYHNGEYTLNVIYEGYYEQLNVILEPYVKEKLPPKAAAYEKVCDTAFVQIGTEYKNLSTDDAPQNGMCYIWRLEDGTFVILDGGFNYAVGAENLYAVLKQLAPEGKKIVISAWFISHFHGDHAGAFVKFANSYRTKIILNAVVFNMPTEQEHLQVDHTWHYWGTIEPLMEYYGATMYIAHPGQVYHFANAKIDVLYTMEMYAPEKFTYYNTSSLVLDVQFGEFNMMMLCDASEYSNPYIRNNYGDSLKSEVVQVAHHGYEGGSFELYALIDPIYVLWPVGGTSFSKMVQNGVIYSKDRNAYFFAENTRILQIFQAGKTVSIFTIEEDVGFTTYTCYASVENFVAGVVKSTELKK